MDIIIKKSGIEGKGVFAARDFKKGEIVIRYDISHKLSQQELANLPKKDRRYVIFLDGKYILMQSPAEYVNHSCSANTFSKDFSDVAKKDIKEGEEITADYSETMAANESMACKCGSLNCRGIIRQKNSAY